MSTLPEVMQVEDLNLGAHSVAEKLLGGRDREQANVLNLLIGVRDEAILDIFESPVVLPCDAQRTVLDPDHFLR